MRHPLLSSLFLCLAWGLGGCQASLPPLPAWQSSEGRDRAELGQIRDLASGELLSPEQLLARLAAAPQVLVGEQHDNPDHHALQLWLLRAMTHQRPQGSLLLEMLTSEQQARIDALEGQEPLPAELPEVIAWQAGWEWPMYGPIVEEALRQPYPLRAADLSPARMREIYRQAPPLIGQRSTAPAVRAALLAQVRDSHCAMLPDSQLPAMLAVQQQRDRYMAEQVLAAPQPSLLFAGSYHVRKDLGVPLHLADLGATGQTLVLMLAEVGEEVTPQSADYVWYTTALPEQDYCAALRKGH